MVAIARLFKALQKKKILVVGDFALDGYVKGKVERVSPEAPVPVLKVVEENSRPGMAGNVVLNLLSLGMEVSCLGRVGKDAAGQGIKALLKKESACVDSLFEEEGFLTPIKRRVIADGQQLIRIDTEEVISLSKELEDHLLEEAAFELKSADAVAISDYAKGLGTSSFLTRLAQLAQAKGIPVIVDPKGKDFSKYGPVTVIKPNKKEAYLASGLEAHASLDCVAKEILSESRAQSLMITRSGEGISCFFREGRREDYSVKIREVIDVTGAGDTVLALLTTSIANGFTLGEAAQLSNLGAGIAIEHFGCARVTLSEIAQRALEDDLNSKIFSEEHLFVLEAALEGKKPPVLVLEGFQAVTPEIFQAAEELSQKGKEPLILYIKDPLPNPHLVSMVASIQFVRFLVLKGDVMVSLFDTISPSRKIVFSHAERVS